jgi:hypothetical protein
MIRYLRQWFADRHARKAARYLHNRRIAREREHIRETARKLRSECNLPPLKALAR